ncbi:MAG: hypothetical protein IKA17_03770 [Clostridia bacterium]|nr:hypothetical protein [Clostridia bacterium]
MIYNGIYKIHKDGADKIHTKEKIYDYIWVGEGVKSIDSVRERTKVYEPYVVPDFNFKTDNEAERYLNTMLNYYKGLCLKAANCKINFKDGTYYMMKSENRDFELSSIYLNYNSNNFET